MCVLQQQGVGFGMHDGLLCVATYRINIYFVKECFVESTSC